MILLKRAAEHLGHRLPLLASMAGVAALFVVTASNAVADDNKGTPGGFKLGLQSYSLREFNVDQAIEKSKEWGLSYWEPFPGHIPMTEDAAVQAEQKKKLSDAGLTVLEYGVFGFNGDDEQAARKVFDYVKAMDFKVISADPNPDQKTFDMLDKLVEEYQIAIAIHNHGPGHRYSTAEDVLKVLEGRHPLIGVCIDTGHFMRSGEESVALVHKFGDRIHGVHIKDAKKIESAEEKERLLKELPQGRAQMLKDEGYIFTILGEGDLNLVGFFRALRDVNFDGIIALEYEENPSDPSADIEKSLRIARNAIAYLDDSEEGFVSLWDGKTFDNWTINENPESWKIENGEIIVNGEVSHLFYTGDLAPFRNFEYKVDVKAGPNSNSGIYICTEFQEKGFPLLGFETQVNNTYNRDPRKTGSIYGVVDVTEQIIPDDVWWTQHVIVKGNRIVVMVDGRIVADYTQPEDFKSSTPFELRLRDGTFAFQAHDPVSKAYFKNIRVKKLD